jgi:hypothetical protein
MRLPNAVVNSLMTLANVHCKIQVVLTIEEFKRLQIVIGNLAQETYMVMYIYIYIHMFFVFVYMYKYIYIYIYID